MITFICQKVCCAVRNNKDGESRSVYSILFLVLVLAERFAFCYFRRRLVIEEGTVSLGVGLSRCVCVRRISLNGEVSALYPVLSRFQCCAFLLFVIFIRESTLNCVARKTIKWRWEELIVRFILSSTTTTDTKTNCHVRQSRKNLRNRYTTKMAAAKFG